MSLVPDGTSVVCGNCDGHSITTELQTRAFEYGAGQDAATLSAEVPVHRCNNCGFQFTDHRAEALIHAATCRHLGVMTPDDVEAVRRAHSMSRAEFARVTRIGEASLARWETGDVIQNGANAPITCSSSDSPKTCSVCGVVKPYAQSAGDPSPICPISISSRPRLSAFGFGWLDSRARRHLLLLQGRRRPNDGARQRRDRARPKRSPCALGGLRSRSTGNRDCSTCSSRLRLRSASLTSFTPISKQAAPLTQERTCTSGRKRRSRTGHCGSCRQARETTLTPLD